MLFAPSDRGPGDTWSIFGSTEGMNSYSSDKSGAELGFENIKSFVVGTFADSDIGGTD